MSTTIATDCLAHATDEIRLARAYLLRVAEPPALALARFIDEEGPLRAADRVRAADVPSDVLDETGARREVDLAARDLDEARDRGARLVVPEDDEWPAWALNSLDLARARGLRWAGQPIALWVRGPHRLIDLADRAVAVVGARSATGYGEHVAADFGYGLTSAGVPVMSGAAYGVDGAAHRGALAAGGPTGAVLGCGVDLPYPAGHAGLLSKIAEVGVVISEYPPGTPPARHRFLVRNRLIAALSTGVVVVEAGRRSGARNTATSARELGRVVMAVPGPITSAMSAGCHELLRSGDACPVGSVAEIIESTGRLGADLVDGPPPESRDTDRLDARSSRVYEALPLRSGDSVEHLAVASGVPLDAVRAVLPALELAGLAERCESGWRRAATKRRGDT